MREKEAEVDLDLKNVKKIEKIDPNPENDGEGLDLRRKRKGQGREIGKEGPNLEIVKTGQGQGTAREADPDRPKNKRLE